MNRLFALFPEHTVTQQSHLLSARRPLCLRPSVFSCIGGGAPRTFEDPALRIFSHPYNLEDKREIAAHDHEHSEVQFVLGGTALHSTEYYTTPVGRGDAIFIAPGQTHTITEIDGLHRVACDFLPEWLVHDASDLWSEPGMLPLLVTPGKGPATREWTAHQHLDERSLELCLGEVRAIDVELLRRSPSLPYLRRCLEKLLIVLGRALAHEDTAPREGSPRREIVHALGIIERSTGSGEPFQVAAVAEECSLSVSHFTRVFRESVGMSPMNYYQQRRIQHACWLLLNTGQSVTEVAFSLGFTDTPYFVRQFHKLRGMSPRSYRERYRPGSTALDS